MLGKNKKQSDDSELGNTKNPISNIHAKPLIKKFDDGITIIYSDANHGDSNIDENKKDILLDPNYVFDVFESIHKACTNKTKYVYPTTVTISNSQNITNSKTQIQDSKPTNVNTFETKLSEPKWSLDEIYLPDSKRRVIKSISNIINNKDKLYKEWGFEKTFKNSRSIVLNFYGVPGTGKSITADAIAKSSGKKIINVNYSELESKYVGDTPKNISKIFKSAKDNNAIIVFDEADSFLGKRIENVQQSADYGVNVTRSVMLMELDNFDGVVIFTTNLFSNYDDAFKRRILMNVEFSLPDERGREMIWNSILPKEFPLDSEITPELLAKRYCDISGADIKDIAFNCAVLALDVLHNCATLHDFDEAHSIVKSRYEQKKTQQIAKITTEKIPVDNTDEAL